MKLKSLLSDNPNLTMHGRRQNQTAKLSGVAEVQGNRHIASMDDISHSAINIEMLDVVIEQAGHREEICKSTAGSNDLMMMS